MIKKLLQNFIPFSKKENGNGKNDHAQASDDCERNPDWGVGYAEETGADEVDAKKYGVDVGNLIPRGREIANGVENPAQISERGENKSGVNGNLVPGFTKK